MVQLEYMIFLKNDKKDNLLRTDNMFVFRM